MIICLNFMRGGCHAGSSQRLCTTPLTENHVAALEPLLRLATYLVDDRGTGQELPWSPQVVGVPHFKSKKTTYACEIAETAQMLPLEEVLPAPPSASSDGQLVGCPTLPSRSPCRGTSLSQDALEW